MSRDDPEGRRARTVPPSTSPSWPWRGAGGGPWRLPGEEFGQEPAQAAPAGTREAQLPPPPPPSPPILNRIAGVVLLAATLGLASCQAFLAAVT